MPDILTIAIDGPAGAGKSTIAKQLASHFEIVYVDTGAMYRAVAYHMIQSGIDLNNEEEVLSGLRDVHIEIIYKDHTQYLYLNGIDITELIRDQIVGEGASKVSAYLPVREKLVAMQQEMAKANSLVMDGRDIGTHVLTEATVKIYLTAEVMVRARRRYDELVQKNIEANLDAIAEEISSRDYRDMNRDNSPLVQAADAVLLDTSAMTINQVVQSIIQIAETR